MKCLYTISDLKECVGGENSIAIYGAGNWARRLVDYAIWENLQNKIKGMIVSKKKEGDSDQYREIPIYEADKFLNQEACAVMVAVSWQYQEEVLQVVRRHGNACYVLAQELYFALAAEMDTRKKVAYRGIDFLCPGFTKCGTSSLHEALMSVRDVYLSPKKESHFFTWRHEVQNSEDILVKNYFDAIKEGQLVGMIEPTFNLKAKEVYEFFGSDIRLVFLVRNPVESTFSRFKMILRGAVLAEEFYQKYDQFSLKMFDDYIERNNGGGLAVSRYIDWIKEFEKYYSGNQIKLVYFEELVKETKAVMDDLLKFIGSKNSYECDMLPRVNEGNYVMADLESYKIALQYKKLSLEYLHCSENDMEAKDKCYRERVKVHNELNKAKKIYHVQISEEQRKRLEMYYYNSVRELEEYSHKDLSKMWF